VLQWGGWRRLRRLVGGGDGALRRTRRSVAIRISVSYWYQCYRRSLKLSRLIHPPCHRNVFESKRTWTLNSADGIWLRRPIAPCNLRGHGYYCFLLQASDIVGANLASTSSARRSESPTAATVRGTCTSPHFASRKSALARCSCALIPFTASPEDFRLTVGHHGDR
jgi:hypothetical protein